MNESVGAGYIDRNWPPALKDFAAWPLTGLRQSFLNGSLTRMPDPDATLRSKIAEFVQRGDFGLASGQNPDGTYQRVWFCEPMGREEVSFDANVFLLTKANAQALKTKPAPEVPEPTKPHEPDETKLQPDREEKPTPTPQATTLRLVGTVPTEVWNRLGTRLLPKLRSGDNLKVGLEFSVTFKADVAQSMEADLRQALQDLGLQDQIKIERCQ